jgi:hypothetical protein
MLVGLLLGHRGQHCPTVTSNTSSWRTNGEHGRSGSLPSGRRGRTLAGYPPCRDGGRKAAASRLSSLSCWWKLIDCGRMCYDVLPNRKQRCWWWCKRRGARSPPPGWTMGPQPIRGNAEPRKPWCRSGAKGTSSATRDKEAPATWPDMRAKEAPVAWSVRILLAVSMLAATG